MYLYVCICMYLMFALVYKMYIIEQFMLLRYSLSKKLSCLSAKFEFCYLIRSCAVICLDLIYLPVFVSVVSLIFIF